MVVSKSHSPLTLAKEPRQNFPQYASVLALATRAATTIAADENVSIAGGRLGKVFSTGISFNTLLELASISKKDDPDNMVNS